MTRRQLILGYRATEMLEQVLPVAAKLRHRGEQPLSRAKLRQKPLNAQLYRKAEAKDFRHDEGGSESEDICGREVFLEEDVAPLL